MTLLVCNELLHECLLGWDFLCTYSLGVKPGNAKGSLKIWRENSRGAVEVVHVAGVNTRCNGRKSNQAHVNQTSKQGRPADKPIPDNLVEAI